MRWRWLIAALVLAIFGPVPEKGIAWGQQGPATPNPGAAQATPAKAGNYSLVITTLEPTPATHWLNPPPTIAVKGGTRLEPAQTESTLIVPPQFVIDAFGVPREECDETAAQQHGCDALDRVDLNLRDPNTVEYRIVSHGAPVQLRINLQVRDLLPVSHGGASTDWHTGDVIFVSVPKPTPSYRFVSETLIGVWKGQPVVFEPGKPLPAAAGKALKDLAIRQDLGDLVLYSYSVR